MMVGTGLSWFLPRVSCLVSAVFLAARGGRYKKEREKERVVSIIQQINCFHLLLLYQRHFFLWNSWFKIKWCFNKNCTWWINCLFSGRKYTFFVLSHGYLYHLMPRYFSFQLKFLPLVFPLKNWMWLWEFKILFSLCRISPHRNPDYNEAFVNIHRLHFV